MRHGVDNGLQIFYDYHTSYRNVSLEIQRNQSPKKLIKDQTEAYSGEKKSETKTILDILICIYAENLETIINWNIIPWI